MKPYRVDFTFTVKETASMFIVAADPEAAAEGARQLLETEPHYQNPEIVSIEEHKKQDQPTIN